MRHRQYSGITTYGLMALEREMSTPPIPRRSVAQFTLPMCHLSAEFRENRPSGSCVILLTSKHTITWMKT